VKLAWSWSVEVILKAPTRQQCICGCYTVKVEEPIQTVSYVADVVNDDNLRLVLSDKETNTVAEMQGIDV